MLHKKNYDYIIKSLYYLSLLFAVYYLYKNNFLDNLLQIENYPMLIFSLLILFAAQLAEIRSMQLAIQMQEKKKDLGYTSTMVVFGKTIFAKYIPGKVFLFIALVFYLNRYKISKTNGLAAMFNFQIFSLWSGLVAGLGFLLIGTGFSNLIKINALVFLLLFAVVILVRPLQRMLDRLLEKILRREVGLFHYPLTKVGNIIGMFMLTWLLNGTAFYLLIAAKTGVFVQWQAVLIFPLARTVGTLAIITPGGLGVREGVIASLMPFCGLSLTAGVAVSVLARIWFFFGELFSYLSGLFIERRERSGGFPS